MESMTVPIAVCTEEDRGNVEDDEDDDDADEVRRSMEEMSCKVTSLRMNVRTVRTLHMLTTTS